MLGLATWHLTSQWGLYPEGGGRGCHGHVFHRESISELARGLLCNPVALRCDTSGSRNQLPDDVCDCVHGFEQGWEYKYMGLNRSQTPETTQFGPYDDRTSENDNFHLAPTASPLQAVTLLSQDTGLRGREHMSHRDWH